LDEKEAQKQERLRQWAQNKQKDDIDSAAFETSLNPEDEPTPEIDENDNKMFVKLRGSDNKDIMLRVKSVSLF
jgi:hypothetical protein